MLAALAGACGRSDPPPAARVAPAPEPAAGSGGGAAVEPFDTAVVEVRIYERRADDKGVDARAKLEGRWVELHAPLGTPLAAAIEANEVLSLELSDAPRSAAEHASATLLMGERTRQVVDFEAWMMPAMVDTLPHAELVGLWRVPAAARSLPIEGGTRTPVLDAFVYDGQYLVVATPRGASWPAPAHGDRHRLPARWLTGTGGDESLQMRIPIGGWQTIASFYLEGKARRLVMFEDGAIWPIERVRKPADADAAERDLATSAAATAQRKP